MSARRRNTGHHRKARNPSKDPYEHGFYTPFANLDQHLEEAKANGALERRNQRQAREPVAEADDTTRFLEAVEDVKPLSRRDRKRIPRGRRRRCPPRFLQQEENEALRQLVALVHGEGSFELNWSDEYIDGAVLGLSPAVMKKLRNGDFSYQAYLDLHGCTRAEARQWVTDFIASKQAQGLRCVLIICGRGLNSRNRRPVLKEHLVRWFTRAPLKGLVLAFSCARSCDGGAGAFYVLLRRQRGNSPVLTPVV